MLTINEHPRTRRLADIQSKKLKESIDDNLKSASIFQDWLREEFKDRESIDIQNQLT
jgi:hypothetical protein